MSARPPHTAAAPDLPGFAFVEPLGRGGFADVFKYTQLGLGRDVAVKVLHTGSLAPGLDSFQAEASVMARLSNHPSIVSIYGADVTPAGAPYLVMEYCPPPHLGDLCRAEPMTVPRALEVAIQLAGAVATAHRLGILHRDIKPANVLLTEFGRAALTDFGISVTTSTATQGGAVGVSVPWAPPEQLSAGAAMGPTSDVYSLAATCWTLLVGRPPFRVLGGENTPLATANRIRTQAVPSTQRPDVPASLDRVLRTAMAKSPADRFDSAVDLARALQSVQAELHLPTTVIDLREEIVARVRDEEEASGTRMSTFVAVDPDGSASRPLDAAAEQTDGTVISAPTGRDAPPQGETPLTFPTRSASVTGGTSPMSDPVPVEVGSRRRVPVAAGILSVAIASVVIVWSVGAGTTTDRGTTGRTDDPTSATVAEPVAEAPPAPTEVAVVPEGSSLAVSWTNPDPRAGDRYGVRLQDPESAQPWSYTATASAQVDSAPGRSCVQVQLVRADGSASPSVTRCPGGGS